MADTTPNLAVNGIPFLCKYLSRKSKLQPYLDNANHAPAIPDLPYVQPGLSYEIRKLGRRSFDPVDNRHHGQIAVMWVAHIIAVIRGQWRRRCWNLLTPSGGIHDLITN